MESQSLQETKEMENQMSARTIPIIQGRIKSLTVLDLKTSPIASQPLCESVKRIQETVATSLHVTRHQMLAKKRVCKDLDWARDIAIFLASDITESPDSFLAPLFHRRRWSFTHARRMVRDILDVDPKAREQVNLLREQLIS